MMKKKQLPLRAKVEIFAAIVCIGVLLIYFSNFNIEDITGYSTIEIYNQDLDIVISESQVYTLEANGGPPFYITSLRLSGEVIGDGGAEISLADTLIYTNIKDAAKGIPAITGFSGAQQAGSKIEGSWLLLNPSEKYSGKWLGELSEGKEPVSGSFENACAETCFISMEMSSDNSYPLIFKVEPGTELHIKALAYTVRE